MSLHIAYSTLVSALVLGVIYSLVSLGYVVVYRSCRVFNFMHPQFMFMGALLFTTLSASNATTMSFAMAMVGATAVTAVFGALVYLLVVHRSVGQPHWIQMVLTMGLGIASVNIAQLIWGTSTRFPALPFQRTTWALPGGARVTSTDLFVVVAGLALCGALYWLLTASPLGVRLRATAENSTLAAYCGIHLGRWFGVAWALAAAAAVVGGVCYSLRVPLDPSITDVGLMAFPAAMIGGMDSIEGSFVGALILGIVQQFTAVLWGPQASVAASFSVVLIVLVVRPRGLFGAPVSDRV